MRRKGIAALIALSLAPAGCARPRGPAPGSDTHASVPDAQAPAERPRVPYAEEKIAAALAAAKNPARVRITLASDSEAMRALSGAGVTLDGRAESFAAFSTPEDTVVIGRDRAGAIYGALALAERLWDQPAAIPLRAPISEAPAVPIRAANVFLVLPAPGESRWYFHEESYWEELLDLMARARLDYLDLHGMYNLDNTVAPNALLYFAKSATHPDIGVPVEEREANARMLAHIVEMAKARGIEVGLMSYRMDTSLVAEDKEPPKLDEEAFAAYTREAVRDLAERIPELARFGFRIGESRHKAAWFRDTFVEGLNGARTRTGLTTRTWLTKKAEIMALVGSTDRDTLVEAKYNGEQTGPPYVIAGGLMARPGWFFSSYSYQDYLDPPAPYTFVFHIWTGGTNRLFRYASYERIRRTVPTTLLGGARGFSMMPPHAFYAQRDFYHASSRELFSPWAFRRDELEYLMFGRLGYDPATPAQVFRDALRRRTATDHLWEPLQAASDIVPWIQVAHTCGPDHRHFAPELEWGGSVGFWASEAEGPQVKATCKTTHHGPYDTFALASPFEAAADLVAGRGTSRLSPIEVAHLVLDDARRARAAESAVYDPVNHEACDIAAESVALSFLGEYFGHKLLGATALAVYERSGRADYLAAARSETATADRAWKELAKRTAYLKPFDERLRMRLQHGFNPAYHWSMQRLDEDAASLDEAARRPHPADPASASLPPARAWLDATRKPGPGFAGLEAAPLGGGRFRVSVTFAAGVPAGAKVRVLHKAFSGLLDWKESDAAGAGSAFTADVDVGQDAGMFAVEVVGGPGVGWRYPDVLRETPYVVVPPARK